MTAYEFLLWLYSEGYFVAKNNKKLTVREVFTLIWDYEEAHGVSSQE